MATFEGYVHSTGKLSLEWFSLQHRTIMQHLPSAASSPA